MDADEIDDAPDGLESDDAPPPVAPLPEESDLAAKAPKASKAAKAAKASKAAKAASAAPKEAAPAKPKAKAAGALKKAGAPGLKRRMAFETRLTGFVTLTSAKRLARRAGAPRTGAGCTNALKEIAKENLEKYVRAAILYTHSRQRSTIGEEDVRAAGQRCGNLVYSTGL